MNGQETELPLSCLYAMLDHELLYSKTFFRWKAGAEKTGLHGEASESRGGHSAAG